MRITFTGNTESSTIPRNVICMKVEDLYFICYCTYTPTFAPTNYIISTAVFTLYFVLAVV